MRFKPDTHFVKHQIILEGFTHVLLELPGKTELFEQIQLYTEPKLTQERSNPT